MADNVLCACSRVVRGKREARKSTPLTQLVSRLEGAYASNAPSVVRSTDTMQMAQSPRGGAARRMYGNTEGEDEQSLDSDNHLHHAAAAAQLHDVRTRPVVEKSLRGSSEMVYFTRAASARNSMRSELPSLEEHDRTGSMGGQRPAERRHSNGSTADPMPAGAPAGKVRSARPGSAAQTSLDGSVRGMSKALASDTSLLESLSASKRNAAGQSRRAWLDEEFEAAAVNASQDSVESSHANGTGNAESGQGANSDDDFIDEDDIAEETGLQGDSIKSAEALLAEHDALAANEAASQRMDSTQHSAAIVDEDDEFGDDLEASEYSNDDQATEDINLSTDRSSHADKHRWPRSAAPVAEIVIEDGPTEVPTARGAADTGRLQALDQTGRTAEVPDTDDLAAGSDAGSDEYSDDLEADFDVDGADSVASSGPKRTPTEPALKDSVDDMPSLSTQFRHQSGGVLNKPKHRAAPLRLSSQGSVRASPSNGRFHPNSARGPLEEGTSVEQSSVVGVVNAEPVPSPRGNQAGQRRDESVSPGLGVGGGSSVDEDDPSFMESFTNHAGLDQSTASADDSVMQAMLSPARSVRQGVRKASKSPTRRGGGPTVLDMTGGVFSAPTRRKQQPTQSTAPSGVSMDNLGSPKGNQDEFGISMRSIEEGLKSYFSATPSVEANLNRAGSSMSMHSRQQSQGTVSGSDTSHVGGMHRSASGPKLSGAAAALFKKAAGTHVPPQQPARLGTLLKSHHPMRI